MEAEDYNNRDLDETMTDVFTIDNQSDIKEAFIDPFQREDDNADTSNYALWSKIMPQFSEKAKLDLYKNDIKNGKKQYKDFYIDFRENFLEQIDDVVGIPDNFDIDHSKQKDKSINLMHWKDLPWEIRVKTYLTVYSVDWECKLAKLS